MATEQIYLAPYSSDWPQQFERERELLIQAVGEWVEDIQHIGSTSIPGIAAKPIIDIMIGVRSLKDADTYCTSKIKQLGYDYIQRYEIDIPKRRYFQKTTSRGVRTHQIHLVEITSDWWQRHLLFRDYLRSHPQAAREYEALKRSLIQIYSDTNEYAAAKTAFIRDIEEKAKRSFEV